MNKALEIGTDYATMFGLDAKGGAKMIYRGGDSWEMHNERGETMTADMPEATANAIETINRPSITMGHM